ncbi:MAG: transcriptional regulator [Alcanivorax sp.]|jgi:hypothetical protein|uniref:hypothetical protein n=3 Tax=Alcanivoracaceae TaxID=224372 RepID=UPI000C599214|nr:MULTISPECIES: hypothetical protein [Alcanivorax]MAC15608.1 transcriptional regulator [Alcanivorax sp.]MBG32280.1 transcriptional regulator [Alcanivorax sp.]MDF1635842.1 hypothetical protein [Alcanivorax jadensis]|tara:strand:- start:1348 stop:1956 length:609 start_codon:yes stop_codon:yes gene_type:complete
MDWLINNKEWIFSGVGVFVIGIFATLMRFKSVPQENAVVNDLSVSGGSGGDNANEAEIESLLVNDERRGKDLDHFKNVTKILFIDDDARFKVVKILSRSGWVHAKLIKDCETLDDRDVVEADILFIDVQGVGVSMGFSDEGLGLALAIKEKYKEKKVIIYSAETEGDRFHEALRKADSFLAKNADPYQFQRLVEEFTIGIGG